MLGLLILKGMNNTVFVVIKSKIYGNMGSMPRKDEFNEKNIYVVVNRIINFRFLW